MKRLIALLMLLSCLWVMAPGVLAEPAQTTEPEAEQTEEIQKTEEAEQTEELQSETPLQTQQPEQSVPDAAPQENDLSALSSETAITTMEVTVFVDEAGRATVTQQLEMQMLGTVEELRFSFPEGAKKTDVAGYWVKSERENGVKYLTISSKSGFSGKQSFQLSYTLDEIVSAGEDSQILTVPLLSLQDYRIGRLTFAVAMPQVFTTSPRFTSGYYGDLAVDVMTVRTEDVWVVGAMNEIMRDNDSLTMTLIVPDGFFVGNFGDSGMPAVMTTITLLLVAVIVVYWLRTLRNPPLRIRARTLPPDGVNPGDLPFLLSGGDTDFNMLVSHWAVLGYLSIYVNKAGHVIIRRRMDMGNERRKLERKLFDLLFGDGDLCDGASVRYKRVGEKAMQVVRGYWSRRLYERRSGSPILARAMCWLACAFAALVSMDAVAPVKGHGFFLFLALVAGAAMGVMIAGVWGAYYLGDWIRAGIGVGCAILLFVIGAAGGAVLAMLPALAVTLFIGFQTCHGGLRRPYGDEVVAQTLGFRRFLMGASEHHVLQMQVRDPQYFYKLLPYAEAMGLGRRFVNLFHDCKLEPCQWYDSAKPVPTTASAFYIHYADTLDMLNLSIKK